MTAAVTGYRRACGAHGGMASLRELTWERRLETGIGGEAGEDRKGRVFQEEGTACVRKLK